MRAVMTPRDLDTEGERSNIKDEVFSGVSLERKPA
jgi:hypothetical protein